MMQWLVLIPLVLVLGIIAMEDFKHRAVRIFWFPMALLMATIYALGFIEFKKMIENTSLILAFLVIQSVLLMAYFVIKNKKWINLTDQYIGWGDVLLMLVIIPLFSPFVYLLFYLSSLLFTISFVLLYQVVYKPMTFIPLAGIQSICLIGLLSWHQFVKQVLFVDDFSFLIHAR